MSGKIDEKIWSVRQMGKEQLAKIVAEKIDAALKANDTPKKFFVTENGRGVVDGGDLYNAVLTEVMNVMKVALVDIITSVVPPPPPPAKTEKLEKTAPPAKLSKK